MSAANSRGSSTCSAIAAAAASRSATTSATSRPAGCSAGNTSTANALRLGSHVPSRSAVRVEAIASALAERWRFLLSRIVQSAVPRASKRATRA